MYEVIDSCSVRTFLGRAGFALGSAGFRDSEHLQNSSPAAATARFRCPGPPYYSAISLFRASILLSKTTLAVQNNHSG